MYKYLYYLIADSDMIGRNLILKFGVKFHRSISEHLKLTQNAQIVK